MHITPKKILFISLVVALLLRTGMVWRNYQKHPDFFLLDRESIQKEINRTDKPYANPFGYEIGNVAYSLVCNNTGFANPFGGDTGPTGWVAPGLVLIYALAFYLFGCFSLGALMFMFAFSLVLSLVMVIVVYTISCYLFSDKSVACITAVLFALCPQDIWLFNLKFQQDFNVYTFLFVFVFLLFLRFIKMRTIENLILFSLTAAMALLFTPVLMLPIGVCILFMFLLSTDHSLPSLKLVALSCLIIALTITPYIIYQKYRLGALTFIKSNGPFELYQGNSKDYDGVLVEKLFREKHPAGNLREYQAYKNMGEIQYVKSKVPVLLEEFDFLRFAELTVKRFFYFFFIYKPYVAHYSFNWYLAIYYLGYIIPGMSMILYMVCRRKKLNRFDVLLYTYILAYALPYLCAGIMYRYSFPVCTLTTIMLGKCVSMTGRFKTAVEKV